ncbi:MAG: 6-phosphogluconolactonase [Actinobacteria bacterium]|nr:6-phosphogluconolactonase [Actinomycetota bacterium]
MKVTTFSDRHLAARHAAMQIAAAAMQSVDERDAFTVAFSGGSTPAPMLAALADLDLPWERTHVFQVDERIAPDGHPDRNLELLREHLTGSIPDWTTRVHPMPVGEDDPSAAAVRYADELRQVCGDPPVLDLVHLGLGHDGHTASLVPGDPVLDDDTDVAATGSYEGRRRLTLTVPLLRRTRVQLWLVAGADKAEAVRRLLRDDAQLPASRVVRDDALLILDDEAAAQIKPDTPANRGGRP